MQELAFCPNCHARIPLDAAICPHCRTSLREWQEKTYVDRLIGALRHPLSEVRMRAIIALGWRGERAAEKPLVECTLRHPIDVVEGLEIVNSLRLIRDNGSDDTELRHLSLHHAARAVRSRSAEILRELPLWQRRGNSIHN
ncbi:MAG: HEAT repeat domain-containing protein [Methylocella sp.]